MVLCCYNQTRTSVAKEGPRNETFYVIVEVDTFICSKTKLSDLVITSDKIDQAKYWVYYLDYTLLDCLPLAHTPSIGNLYHIETVNYHSILCKLFWYNM